jgi:hypothetical protein
MSQVSWKALAALGAGLLIAGCATKQESVKPDAERTAEQEQAAPAQTDWQNIPPLQLTDSSSDQANPHFAPDGSNIIYQSNSDGNWELYTLNLDDLRPQRITETPESEEDPTISPDGKWILCTVYPAALGENLPRDILLMDREGKQRQILARHGADDWSPRFSADGGSVWFLSDRLDERADLPDYERQAALFRLDLQTGEVEHVDGPGDLAAPLVFEQGVLLVRNAGELAWAAGNAGNLALAGSVPSDWKLGSASHLGKSAQWICAVMPDLSTSRLGYWNGSSWSELPLGELEAARGPAMSPTSDKLVFYGRNDDQWDLFMIKLRP